MKINSLILENFRSFKEPIIIEELSDVNIFIGPNNAGKSNILEALRYIKSLATGGNPLKAYFEMVFDGKTKRNIQFTLTFSLSTEERLDFINELFSKNSKIKADEVLKSVFLSTLTYDATLGNRGLIQEKLTVKNIRDGDLIIFQGTPIKEKVMYKALNLFSECTKLEKVTNIQNNLKDYGRPLSPGLRLFNFNVSAPLDINKKIFLKINNFPTKWEWLEPIRRSQPEMTAGEHGKLDSAGTGLVGFLFTLQINDQTERNRLKNEIMKILPIVKAIVTPLSGDKVKLTIGETGLESLRDLNNISFGLKQILILVCGIMNADTNSLILIEEPELFLHAGSQRKLFELIKKEAKEKQFFITTHSSIFTGCTNNISTYLVTKKEGISNVRQIVEPTGMKCIKNELGYRNTDFFSYEAVVFIEGDSEEVAFPIIANALGYDLIEKGICSCRF